MPAAAATLPGSASPRPPRARPTWLDEPTRIRQALVQAEGNVLRAARLLGLGRGALRHRMRRYGIGIPSHEEVTHQPVPPSGRASGPRARPWRQIGPANLPAPQQDQTTAPPAGREVPSLAADWAQKPVSILAISVTFPEPAEPRRPGSSRGRWRLAGSSTSRRKSNGFGGLLLQRSPSLLRGRVRPPQDVGAAAAACRAGGAGDPAGGGGGGGIVVRASCPAVRLAVHGGAVLVDVQARDPAARVLPVGETLTLPVRLLGLAAPGDILLSAQAGRLAEGWCELQQREIAADR